MQLSIVIPAYNEGRRIGPTLRVLGSYLEDARSLRWDSWEAIVVDDGSADDTREVVAQVAREFPQVRCLTYAPNAGKGFALRQGIQATRGQLVLFMDADGSTPIAEIETLLRSLDDPEVSVAIGSRSVATSVIPRPQPLRRRVLGRCFSSFTRAVVGVPFRDTQCGFKLFRGDAAREIFAAARCDGFAIDLEILMLAQRHGRGVREVGIEWHDDPDSRVRPVRDGLRMLCDSLALRWRVGTAGTAARYALVILFALAGARLLTLGLWPLIDSTEARYAQVARDMLESGDWVTPMIWDHGEHVPYLGKPPLQFWLMGLSYSTFGVNELAARIPSLACAVLLAGVMFVCLRRQLGTPTALLACGILATCPLFFLLTGSAVLDTSLTLCVGSAYFLYLSALEARTPRGRRGHVIAACAFLGLGMLAKGPVALALFGIPALIVTIRSPGRLGWREFPWLWSILVFCGVWLPWYLACEAANPGFMRYFFVSENFLRYFARDYGDLYGMGHTFPYGAAILFMLVAISPWALLLLVRATIWRRRDRAVQDQRPDRSAYLIGFVAMIAFLSLSRQLTMAYVLPAVPMFAAWAAARLMSSGDGRLAWRYTAGVGVVSVLIILAFTPWLDSHRSTKRIFEAVEQTATAPDPEIVFIWRTPYSAYFYGHGAIVGTPWAGVDASIERQLAGGHDEAVFIVRNKLVAHISPEHMARLRKIWEGPSTSIYEQVR